MQFKTIFLLSFMTFFSISSYSQCAAGAVNSTIWGTPDDFTLGFTIDNDLTDIDTVRITQGVDTLVVLQYLLPKKQAITSPITGTATVNSVQIQGVSGLPIGINWTLDAAANGNNNTYNPQTYRYGAVTMCGTTFGAPGVRTLTVSTLGCGSLSGISQCQPVTFPLYLEVLPGSGGNTGFSFTPPVGCNDIDVDFEALFVSPDPILNPVDFNWDLGDGTTTTGTNINAHNYPTPGVFPIEMDVLVNEFYISQVSLSNVTSASDLVSGMDISGNFAGGALSEIGNDDTPTWSTDITITNLTLNSSFSDNDAVFGIPSSEDLGDYAYNLQPGDLVDGNQVGYSAAGNYFVSIIINERVASTITFNDTVSVYNNSTATANTSNGTLFCEGDSTILDLGTGSFDFVQWYNDTTLILGETNSTLTVFNSGIYSAVVLNTGNICEGNSNTITVIVESVGAVAITQTSTGLEIDNPNGHTVQWFSNGVPIPGATMDELTDLSSGNPFSASLTNANNCNATSADFNALLLAAGTSTQSGTSISNTQDITFEASGFSLCNGQEIGWAVSTQADGAITDMAGLQTAIDAGWVYPSSSLNTFDATCGNTTFPAGDYFMTPFSADALVIEPVYWNANTDSGYCDAVMELCIGLSGTDYSVDPLTIELPDGTIIDVLTELAAGIIPAGTPIDPTLWQFATSQFGDPLCIDFISILAYYGNPNGTWKINVPNNGTGALGFNIPDFNVVVNASSCDSLAVDQIIPIGGVSGSVAAGQTSVFEIVVPPIPTNFPEITPSCLLFGTATTFNSSCPTAIEDIVDLENINLFPNPNNGLFNLEFDLKTSSNVNISIIDITGRKVLDRNYPNAVNKFSETFDLKNNLSSGFYFLDIQIGNEHTQKKFIVK